jgi:hypothetical protein
MQVMSIVAAHGKYKSITTTLTETTPPAPSLTTTPTANKKSQVDLKTNGKIGQKVKKKKKTNININT